jgi:hypothetical protein
MFSKLSDRNSYWSRLNGSHTWAEQQLHHLILWQADVHFDSMNAVSCCAASQSLDEICCSAPRDGSRSKSRYLLSRPRSGLSSVPNDIVKRRTLQRARTALILVAGT